MAALPYSSRLLSRTAHKLCAQICPRCHRPFSCTAPLLSGHNRWSKIKHDKGKADAKKNNQRSAVSQAIATYSRLYGPDPSFNAALASAIALARKASVPKHIIDQAIARGQGRSLSGTALEAMKVEVMIGSHAFILDVETDNRLRALQEIGETIRNHEGRTGSAEFLFSRLGRVVFERHEEMDLGGIMDEAIELGAEDLEKDAEGNMVVWSQPSSTMQIAQGLARKCGLKVLSSHLIWQPNEDTRSNVDSAEDLKHLSAFVDSLLEMPDVQAIYSNAARGGSLSEDEWAAFENKLDS